MSTQPTSLEHSKVISPPIPPQLAMTDILKSRPTLSPQEGTASGHAVEALVSAGAQPQYVRMVRLRDIARALAHGATPVSGRRVSQPMLVQVIAVSRTCPCFRQSGKNRAQQGP